MGEVWRVTFADDFRVITKTLPNFGACDAKFQDTQEPASLEKEAQMLAYLSDNSLPTLTKTLF